MDKNFSTWQYSQKVEPVSTEPERSTPDKWLPQIPDFVRRNVIAVALIPFFFAPPSHSALQDEVSKYGFNKQAFDNPTLLKKHQWVYPSSFEAPSYTALQNEISQYGWRGVTRDNPVLSRDIRWSYPYFFSDSQLHQAPGVEDVTLDKWYVRISEPVLPRKSQWTYPWIAQPPSLNALENDASQYGWQRDYNRNPIPKRFPWYAYPPFVADTLLHQTPTAQVTSVTVESIGLDFYAEQTRSIELFAHQTATLDFYAEQTRSIDFER